MRIIAVVASLLFLAPTASAKTLPEIHTLANDVVLALGINGKDFCSATVVSRTKNLAATANHCAELAKTVVYFIDWTKESKKVKYEYYDTLTVTNRKMKENGEVYSTQVCDAEVLGVDEVTDVALLEIESRCYYDNEAKPTTDKVDYGDTVYTMGNPFMVYNAVSVATVTQPQARHENIGDFPVIMFQGQIAPGSSGGALVNEDGEYIGTTNWGTGMLAFASPVSNLINLLKKLKLNV